MLQWGTFEDGVFGCLLPTALNSQLRTGAAQITEDTEGVVSVTCHPDHSVTTMDQNNQKTKWDGEWVSYNPRYN
jgi:hypothetical protein